MERDCRNLVVIEAKRVDTEEVITTTVPVSIPVSDLGQRYQLADLVHALYPKAELRSFADEAASFLAPKLLVVAIYRRDPDRAETDEANCHLRLFEP